MTHKNVVYSSADIDDLRWILARYPRHGLRSVVKNVMVSLYKETCKTQAALARHLNRRNALGRRWSQSRVSEAINGTNSRGGATHNADDIYEILSALGRSVDDFEREIQLECLEASGAREAMRQALREVDPILVGFDRQRLTFDQVHVTAHAAVEGGWVDHLVELFEQQFEDSPLLFNLCEALIEAHHLQRFGSPMRHRLLDTVDLLAQNVSALRPEFESLVDLSLALNKSNHFLAFVRALAALGQNPLRLNATISNFAEGSNWRYYQPKGTGATEPARARAFRECLAVAQSPDYGRLPFMIVLLLEHYRPETHTGEAYPGFAALLNRAGLTRAKCPLEWEALERLLGRSDVPDTGVT